MLLAFCLTAALYLPGINGQFISDDLYQIARNEWIKDFSNISNILFSSVWDFLPGEGDSNYYRPVKYILYTFSYQLSGLESWGYHLMKIILHAINTVLVFLLSSSLLKNEGYDQDERWSAQGVSLAAFFAALFFGFHTINSEAVSWIAAVPEVSFTLFALLAMLFYIKDRYILTAIAFLLSALSKETGMMLPFALVAYDLTLRRDSVFVIKKIIGRYLPTVIAGFVFIAMRTYSLHGDFLALGETGTNRMLSYYEFFLNLPTLFFLYVRKVLVPIDITFFYFNLFEPVRSISDVRAIYCLIFFIAFIALMVRLYRRSRLMLFAILWFLIMIAPPFYLAWKSASPVYESRYLYGASVGYAIFAASFFASIAAWQKPGRIKSAWVVALIVAVLYGAGTLNRIPDWDSEYTIWKDAATKNPTSRQARVSYAIELAKLERLDEAMGELLAAKEIDPRSSAVYNNLGIVFAKKGDIREAARNFDLAVRLDTTGDYPEAKTNLDQAIRILEGR